MAKRTLCDKFKFFTWKYFSNYHLLKETNKKNQLPKLINIGGKRFN